MVVQSLILAMGSSLLLEYHCYSNVRKSKPSTDEQFPGKGGKWSRQNQCIWSHVDLGRPSNTLPAPLLSSHIKNCRSSSSSGMRCAKQTTASRALGYFRMWRLPLASATREVCAQSAQHEFLSDAIGEAAAKSRQHRLPTESEPGAS